MKHINILLAAVFALFMGSCADTEPTRMTYPDNITAPTFEIDGIDTIYTQGIKSMVESDVIFNMKATSDVGLTKLTMNNEVVKIFAHGQIRENFQYKFIMPDVKDTTLVFTLYDELDQTVAMEPIKVIAAGRMDADFYLSDLQGVQLGFEANVPYPMAQGAAQENSKSQFEMALGKSHLESGNSLYLKRYWENQNPETFAFAQDDPAGGEEKCLRVRKTVKALNFQFRLAQPLPSALLEDIMTDKRVIVMDVYIDGSSFVAGDSKMTFNYANFEKYFNDKSGMVRACGSKWMFIKDDFKKWRTVVFDFDGSINCGKDPNFITTSEVDLLPVKISTPGSYDFYFKNLRIVKRSLLN